MWQACGYRYCPPCRSLANPRRRSGPQKGNCSSKRSGLSKEDREKGEGFVIVTMISRGARFADGTTYDKNALYRQRYPYGGRPTCGCCCFYLRNQIRADQSARSTSLRSRLTHRSAQFSGGVCVRLLVYKMSSARHILATFCMSLLVLCGKQSNLDMSLLV